MNNSSSGKNEYIRTRRVPVDRNGLAKNGLITGNEVSPYADSFKILRTRVLQRMREKGWRTLGITSPGRHEGGCTSVSANLGICMAMEKNQPVLIVDANLKEPGLLKVFGINHVHGVADYLLGTTALHKIMLQPEGMERLMLLPGNRPVTGSAELMGAPVAAELVKELMMQEPDRIVLFDLPSLGTAETLAFLPLMDAVLIVIEAGTTQKNELETAMQLIHPVPLIGTVLNQLEA